MEADIRKLSKRREGGGDDSDDEPSKKKTKKTSSYLEEELAKYAKGRGLHSKSKKDGKRKGGDDILTALDTFRSRLKSKMLDTTGDEDADKDKEKEDEEKEEGAIPPGVEDDPGMEVDDDRDFMSHVLQFPKDDGEESRKAERDYEVIDPRQRGAKAKEEERERKRAMKARGGGGGSRYRR